MHCPRCGNVVLDELDRNGITVDRCGSCRGVWLDRGELEKLIARETAEAGAPAPAAAYPPAAPSGAYPPDRRYAYDDREPPSSSRRGHHHRHKHRSFWLDLFD